MSGIMNVCGSIYRRCRWRIAGSVLRHSIQPKCEVAKSISGPVLIIAPHSDDEWIGCSTLFSRLDVTVCDANMSGDDALEIHAKRQLEMRMLADRYKHSIVQLKGDKASHLSSIIQEGEFRSLFVPFFIDWHREHIQTIEIFRAALAKIPSTKDIRVVMYPVSVPMPQQAVDWAIGMTKAQQKRKWKTFYEVYKTQHFMPIYRFEAYERSYGKYVNAYAAEVFMVVSAIEWMRMMDKGITFAPEDIRRDLNNIMKTYQYVEEIWEGIK